MAMAMVRERGGGGGGGGKGNIGSSSATLGSNRTGSGSGGKAVVLIELKHRILAALHKLSDRDTQQLAVEELERIGQSLTPEGITLFLACLYDTDAQQKSVVRRECIKLVGTLASLHGDMLAGHLPKMVSNIVRRLKDPDSNIRDACVDTVGVLAGQIGGVEAGAAVSVFVKPLLEALGEQNRNLQVGASLCLARVIDCCKDPHPPTLQRLCPRVVKLLANPNFLAKASLLTVVGGLVQVEIREMRETLVALLLLVFVFFLGFCEVGLVQLGRETAIGISDVSNVGCVWDSHSWGEKPQWKIECARMCD